jgi:PAS domain S-box-containing protein
MSHVSGLFLNDCLKALARRNVDLGDLLSGLPLDAERLESNPPVIEWDVFVELIERIENRVGGKEGLEKLGEAVTELSPVPVLRRLAGLTASPDALYGATMQWLVPRYLPILESRIDTLSDQRISIVCRIPGNKLPCPQVFHLLTGAFRALPHVLALPNSEVMPDVQARWGEWIVIPPPSRSIFNRIYQMARVLFSARAGVEQFDAQQRELELSFRKLRGTYAELEENEARFRALAESAVDLIVELAPDGELRYVSPSAQELVGHPPESWLESNLLDWIHPDDCETISDYLSDIFAFSPRWHERPTFRMVHLENEWVWMEMEARIYRTRTGVNCAVAILRDVSQRVALEEHERRYRENLESRVAERTTELERRNQELRQMQSLLLDAERLGTAQDLAGRVAHSINNPLSALMGQVQLMMHDAEEPDPQLQEILDLSARVGQVVRSTLELYREGKINRAPESMERIISDMVESISEGASARGIALRWTVDPIIPNVELDRPLLLSALENLAENAIDWMPDGGEISFDVSLEESGQRVRIAVADNGPGVPDENKERIFEPFFTTKKNGTGLGLAIARGVFHGHQGEIFATDRLGGGTLFIAELPLLDVSPLKEASRTR